MKPTLEQIKLAVDKNGGFRPAERALKAVGFDISATSIRRMFSDTVEVLNPPGSPIEFEELFSRRIGQFKKKFDKHNAEQITKVKVNLEGPIGLGFMGDPHVDDDGTDILKLFQHADIFDGSTEGLMAGCLGDMWNNWSGRLARLWSEQSTSAEEAKVLVDEFLNRISWLFVIWGNHDVWDGRESLLSSMMNGNVGAAKKSRINLALKFPNGKECKILAANDFPGRSMWSESFGPAKRAQLDGHNHIYVCGDTHTSSYTHGKHNGVDQMWHALRVGSYKTLDRYAEELNLLDHALYQCPVALIDPNATDQMNFIRWEFDPFEARERLKWMRKRFKQGKSSN